MTGHATAIIVTPEGDRETKMQQQDKSAPPVKGLFAYFREIIRFHDAGTPRFVQLLFVLMLAVLYGAVLLMAPYVRQLDVLYQGIVNRLVEAVDNDAALRILEEVLTPEKRAALVSAVGAVLGISLVARVLAQGMAILYGYVWHQGRLSPEHTVRQTMHAFFFRLPRLAAVNLLFYTALLAAGIAVSVVFGVLSVLIPVFAVLLSVMVPILFLVATGLFAFRDMSVLAGRTRVLETFKASWKLTDGARRVIVGNLVMLNVLAMLISSMAGGNADGSPVAAFVVTFLDVIMQLVTQRLVVRMYEDAREAHVHRPGSVVETGNP
jgi:hypothetical protein